MIMEDYKEQLQRTEGQQAIMKGFDPRIQIAFDEYIVLLMRVV